MAVALRSQSSINFTTAGAGTVTVTAPAGIQNNDILVIFLVTLGGGAAMTATPPSGFTLPTVTSGSGFPFAFPAGGGPTNQNGYIWTKVAASESGNYAITTAGGTGGTGYQVWMGAYSGADPSSAVEFCTTNSGTGTTSTATGGTASNAGDGVIYMESDFNDTDNVLSPPSGTTPTFTGEYVAWVTGVNDNFVVADGAMSAGGSTGNPAITNNNTGADPWGAFLLGLNVAPSGGGDLNIYRIN